MCSKDGTANDDGLATTETRGTIFVRVPSRSHLVSIPRPEFLTAMSDANWAGDRQTRKSTSGGVVMFGQHYIKSWSKTQSLIALSSAESDALVKCVSELLGIRSALKDWGSNVGGVVKTDASAACWASFRAGSGQSPTH